jgi:hypothetical protein
MLLAAGCSTMAPDGGGGAAPPPQQPSAPAAMVPGMPRWSPVAGLRVPRDDFGTAVVGKSIWVLGGMTGDRGTRLDSIEVLDTTRQRWRLADTRLPEALASFEAAAVGADIYVFGGLDRRTRPSDFAAVLDTSTGRWHRLPPLPTARYSHTVTLHDGVIHVIGGEGQDGPVRQVDVFDPTTESWSRGAPMPQARGSHDAVSAGEVVYVLGGWIDGEPSDVVQTYDPTTRRWAATTPLPEPVSRAGAAQVDGVVFVSLHAASYTLDLESGTWSGANPLTVPRHGLGYVAVGERVFAIGGCAESPLRDVRTVDVLDVTEL